ncbi:hypothetical protein NXV35_12195 [Bacteroides faecis]|uniref:hypothetical protein n=1 Tax=Bacteroides faecis TaxID=674529 RepID=UPI00101FDE5C|nr:hypothetical protein [Bacteroides faecis]KAA5267545.1 hypothetical protein F2Z41_13840 [Bacteroides faecis]MCE9010742.1 hypothetical protein [Bacteroides faecis]MCS2652159.1 hypothetical protein [Bacteroides faecis]
MFSRTGSYPLENLSKANRWVKLADSLDWKHIEDEYNKRLSNQSRGACNKPVLQNRGVVAVKHDPASSDIPRRSIRGRDSYVKQKSGCFTCYIKTFKVLSIL